MDSSPRKRPHAKPFPTMNMYQQKQRGGCGNARGIRGGVRHIGKVATWHGNRSK